MKKLYLLPICVIASALLFNGCDEKKNNLGMLFMLLAGAGQPGPLTVQSVSPASGSTGLSQQGLSIIITFNRPTDGSLGTVTLKHRWGPTEAETETVVYQSGDPFCDLSFNASNTILTIDPMYALGDPYYDIIVSGFSDADGTLMDVYEDPSYIFTMKTYPWMVSEPDDGDIDVPLDDDIEISFEGELDDTVIGTVMLTEVTADPGDTDPVINYTHSVNCTITISPGFYGSIVTVNPYPAFDFKILTDYKILSISGFRDPYGNNVDARTFADYNFTTVDIN